MEQRHSISPRDEALERIKCYIAQNRLAPQDQTARRAGAVRPVGGEPGHPA